MTVELRAWPKVSMEPLTSFCVRENLAEGLSRLPREQYSLPKSHSAKTIACFVEAQTRVDRSPFASQRAPSPQVLSLVPEVPRN